MYIHDATEISYKNGYEKGKDDAVGIELRWAVEMLQSEYEKAKKQEFIRNPLAYALYKVWKEADRKNRR